MNNVSRKPRASLKGTRVTVIGLGRFGGGLGVTKWLCGQGARVTVTDKDDAAALAKSVAALKGLDVELHLGGHDEADFLKTDLLIVNPAIPKTMPLLARALAAGVPWTTEINMFIERCCAPIVGITGSVGKSTTTAMIGEILARKFTTHVGGNIGRSLLEGLDTIKPQHVVVLELSSFQLEDLPRVAISPHVAVVTNLIPNHLDRHGTMDAYGDAKKNIFRFQAPWDVLVLNRRCPVISQWAAEARGMVEFFDEQTDAIDLVLPGMHNQANAQAALVACTQMGIDRAMAAEVLKSFPGLPHRLQFVTERDGVRYFNDSKCTTPEGAIVAVEAFEHRRAIIIVGGYDKHVSFDVMGAALAVRAKAVIAIGATQQQIVDATRKHIGPSAEPRILCPATFADAVAAAQSQAVAGDVVLLSPACASYDMFQNYEQRGERFVELVK